MMKTRILIFIGLILLMLNSCFVKSLHPFYKKENVVFNDKLLGPGSIRIPVSGPSASTNVPWDL